MILTTCAVCATPLDHEAPAHCANCQTRYCSDRCLRYHAHRGGYDEECEEISRGGGAEQFNADKKYDEAAAVAVEACAEETAGHTCYICLEDGSEEGLVRGCACRGTAGIAHLSCLAEQARSSRWARWYNCRLCEQRFHGVVACALGWACWKTYASRPADDHIRSDAMNILGIGLSDHTVRRFEEAVQVYEADLAHMKRYEGDNIQGLLATRHNIAACLSDLNRAEEALPLLRDIFAETRDAFGPEDETTLYAVDALSFAMLKSEAYAECVQFFRDNGLIDSATRLLGPDRECVLAIRRTYARAMYNCENTPLGDLRQAVEILEEVSRISSRVLGPRHPHTFRSEKCLGEAREKLAQAEAPVARRTRSKAEES